jgi:hypothetical protein
MRFWLFLLSPLLLGAAFFGPRDLSFGFLRISPQGLALGMTMSARAVCLLLTFQIALGVAYNMLSTLSEISLIVLYTLRLRGAGFFIASTAA